MVNLACFPPQKRGKKNNTLQARRASHHHQGSCAAVGTLYHIRSPQAHSQAQLDLRCVVISLGLQCAVEALAVVVPQTLAGARQSADFRQVQPHTLVQL